MGHDNKHYHGNGSYNEEDSDEDESDAVDDSCSNHPVVHHSLILIFLMT